MAQEPNHTDAPEGAGSAPETNASTSKMNAKVELDLDDAPFLEEEDEPGPAPEKKPEPAQRAPAPAAPEKELSLKDRLLADRKRLVLAAGGAVVLIIAAIAVNVFLFSGEDAPPPPETPVAEPEKVPVSPQPLPEAPVPQFVAQFEPFWLELKDTEGAIRFLTCRFSVPTDNPVLFGELNAKRLILRDALFYYLRNQPIISLKDEDRTRMFKEDLMTVMNEHLGSGKISEILIEDYLVR